MTLVEIAQVSLQIILIQYALLTTLPHPWDRQRDSKNTYLHERNLQQWLMKASLGQ